MKKMILGAVAFLAAGAVHAADIKVMDAYARSTNPKVAAAFMGIHNLAEEGDRLISAHSDVAKRVELHTHRKVGDVMKMVHVEEGFEVPASGQAMLERGGKHVMFMGLIEPLKQGDEIEVTLTFENAGDVVLFVPVDNTRKPETAKHGGHGN